MVNKQNAPRPKTWLVESILVTIFCCLPFGIVSIINAAQVDGKYSSGDIDGAQRSSDEAKRWLNYSIIAAVVGIVLYIILVGFGLALSEY